MTTEPLGEGLAQIGAKVPGRIGRPLDYELELYRALFREWSPRQIARYALAMRTLRFAGDDPLEAIRVATRPNGSLNVSKLDRLAAQAIVRWVRAREADA